MIDDYGIHNEDHIRQIKDFSGMRWGKLRPTDIDGAMDFGGLSFIFFELKYRDAGLTLGQRILAEHLIDTIQSAGKDGIYIVATHNHPPGERIDVANTIVVEAYTDKEWRGPSSPTCLRDFVDEFVDFSEDYGVNGSHR